MECRCFCVSSLTLLYKSYKATKLYIIFSGLNEDYIMECQWT